MEHDIGSTVTYIRGASTYSGVIVEHWESGRLKGLTVENDDGTRTDITLEQIK